MFACFCARSSATSAERFWIVVAGVGVDLNRFRDQGLGFRVKNRRRLSGCTHACGLRIYSSQPYSIHLDYRRKQKTKNETETLQHGGLCPDKRGEAWEAPSPS